MQESDIIYNLSSNQVKLVEKIISEQIKINPKIGSEFILLTPLQFLKSIYYKCKIQNIQINNICLIGGTASYIVSQNFEQKINIDYNDIDFNIYTSASIELFQNIRNIIFECFFELYENQILNKKDDINQTIYIKDQFFNNNLNNGSRSNNLVKYSEMNFDDKISYKSKICEKYLSKLVLISNKDELWSLHGFGNYCEQIMDIKIVNNLKRYYEFSIDSFQIGILSLIDINFDYINLNNKIQNEHYFDCLCLKRCFHNSHIQNKNIKLDECFDKLKITKHLPLYCKYINAKNALDHLKNRLIMTNNIDKIFGGGLLKYILLITKNYKLHPDFTQDIINNMFLSFYRDINLNNFSKKISMYLSFHTNNIHFQKSYLTQFLNILIKTQNFVNIPYIKQSIDIILGMITNLDFKITLSNCNSKSVDNNLPFNFEPFITNIKKYNSFYHLNSRSSDCDYYDDVNSNKLYFSDKTISSFEQQPFMIKSYSNGIFQDANPNFIYVYPESAPLKNNKRKRRKSKKKQKLNSESCNSDLLVYNQETNHDHK